MFYYENGTRNDLASEEFGKFKCTKTIEYFALILSFLRSFFFVIDKDFIYPGIIPMKSETHGGDDVAVFAMGKFKFAFFLIQSNLKRIFFAYSL